MMITIPKMGHKRGYVYVCRAGAMAGCGIPDKAQIFRAGFIAGMIFPLLPEVAK
jgi:hypothetical protein